MSVAPSPFLRTYTPVSAFIYARTREAQTGETQTREAQTGETQTREAQTEEELGDGKNDLSHPVSHWDFFGIAEIDLAGRVPLRGTLTNPGLEESEGPRNVLVGPTVNQHSLAARRQRTHLDVVNPDRPIYLEPNLNVGLLSREGVVASVRSAQHSRSGPKELFA